MGARINRLRLAIFLRDDFTCLYCDKVFEISDLTVDHVIPKSKGGRDQPGNLMASCLNCNKNKGNLSLGRVAKKLQNNDLIETYKSRRKKNINKCRGFIKALTLLLGEDAISELNSLARKIRTSTKWSVK